MEPKQHKELLDTLHTIGRNIAQAASRNAELLDSVDGSLVYIANVMIVAVMVAAIMFGVDRWG